jgi:hypothetical protein
MANNLLLDLSDFVRVVNNTGEPIKGRYDGKNYVFPDGADGSYTDVHRTVAQHILGFMLPDQSDSPEQPDKIPVLHRLGWIKDSTTFESALRKLKQVRFLEVPQFPSHIVPFKRSEAESEGAGPLASSMGEGASESSPADSDAPHTSQQGMTLTLPKDPFAQPKKKAQ